MGSPKPQADDFVRDLLSEMGDRRLLNDVDEDLQLEIGNSLALIARTHLLSSESAKPKTCADETAITAAYFRHGDVVRLRSGGHLMTVVSVGCGDVSVAWSCDGKIEEGEFPRAALRVLSAEQLRLEVWRLEQENEIPF